MGIKDVVKGVDDFFHEDEKDTPEKKVSRKKWEEKEKEEMKKPLLGHLIYQIGMMRRCFYRCKESSYHFQNKDEVDEDLMVAFLTNIRVLYKFFIKPGEEREAHASDYISNWKIENIEMDKWYRQINSYLSHLDYERVEGKRGYEIYQIGRLYTYFRELIIEFIDKIPENFITKELSELSEQLKREIGNK